MAEKFGCTSIELVLQKLVPYGEIAARKKIYETFVYSN